MKKDDDPEAPATVLASGDPALLAAARSLLEEAGIEYVAIEVGLSSAGGWSVDPVRIQVAAEDAEQASALLQEWLRPGERA